MKIPFVLTLIFLIAGCANVQMQQQQQAARERTEKQRQEMITLNAECKAKWESDRRIDPVRDKLPFNLFEATLAQRGNTDRVAPEEKSAIEAVDDVGRWCRQRGAEILSKYVTPQHMALLYKAQAEGRRRRADLWGGKLTYGEYITESDAAVGKLVADDAALTAELNQKAVSLQTQQAQAEAARQQAASAAMTQTLQGLYMMNQASQPRYLSSPPGFPNRTNCTATGKNIACTTW